MGTTVLLTTQYLDEADRLAGVLGALAVALTFAYAWSWVMVVIGPIVIVRSAETVQVVGYLVLFPLDYASSVFVPTATMPGWL